MIQRVCHLLRMQPPVVDNPGLLWLSGATVPTDGVNGYQTGCLFLHTDGGAGTALYVNEGSVTSCAFKAVDAGGITTSLDVGVFSSLTAGSGIALSSSDRSAVAVYGDDNGLAIASNVYNIRSRLLLTVDQDGASIRALMAQLKLADGVDVSTGIYTASQGYLELAGDTVAETGATLSCFDASFEVGAGNTLTVDSGGEVTGLHVETTGTGTITNNGTCAGILIKNAAGAPDWPIGILVDGPSVSCGISIGSFASSQALGSAVRMGISTPTTAAVSVFGETAAALGYGYMTRTIRGRHLINVSGNVNQETYGVQGQLVVKSATLQHLHAGVLGTIEAASSVTLANGLGYTYAHAGVMSRVGGLAAQITATTPLCGFLAFLNDQAGAGLAGATTCVAYAAYANSTWTTEWDIGFVADGCTTGVQIGACTTGILTSGATATDEIKLNMTASTRAIFITGGPMDGIKFEGSTTTRRFMFFKQDFGTRHASAGDDNFWGCYLHQTHGINSANAHFIGVASYLNNDVGDVFQQLNFEASIHCSAGVNRLAAFHAELLVTAAPSASGAAWGDTGMRYLGALIRQNPGNTQEGEAAIAIDDDWNAGIWMDPSELTHIFKFQAAGGSMEVNAADVSGTSTTHALRIDIGGVDHWIPVYNTKSW